MAKRTPNRIPQQARTFQQLLDLPRDHVEGAGWWLIFNSDEIMICNQHAEEEPTGKVKLRRRDWDAIVRWYTTGVWRKR